MEHVRALLIKAVGLAIFMAVFALFYYDTVPTAAIVSYSILTLGLTYVIGDLFLLPMTNNAVAIVGDIIIWWSLAAIILGNYFPPLLVGIVATVVIGIGEAYFHAYMKNTVLRQRVT